MKKIIMLSLVALVTGCSENLYISKPDYSQDKSLRLMTSYNKVAPVESATLTWVKSASATSPDPVITFTPNLNYDKKFYLYFNPNALYNDSSSFATNSFGQPEGSGLATSSVEQVGALTSSLIAVAGKAAGALAGAAIVSGTPNKQLDACDTPSPGNDHLPATIADVASFTRVIPIDTTYPNVVNVVTDARYPIIANVQPIDANGAPLASPKTIPCGFDLKIDINPIPMNGKSEPQSFDTEFDGFLVYDPAPAVITLKAKDDTVIYTNLIETYTRWHREAPDRAFWTSPADTYTLKGGVLVGHTFTQQSPIKTVVDFIVAPIQAAMPGGTSQTQTTAVAGKTTSTTTSSGLTFK